MNLNKLLCPEKICIVGASEKSGFGGDTSRNVIQLTKEGKYYFVNPGRKSIFGHPCYSSIAELPENIDLAVLCTPQATIIDLMKQAKEKGASAALVFASGYNEIGTEEGKRNQEELQETARALGMSVMGPNCAGFINYVDAVSPFAFISTERDRKGSIGIVSQSGQLCLSMMDSPFAKFSFVISAGNCDVVDMEDYIDFLVDNDETKVLAVYIEGVKKPEKFVAALKKAAMKRKPVVILKTGKSEKGQQLAASHTGSLAGSDRFFEALFRKFGVIRVDDLEELLFTSHVLATIPVLPQNTSFASMNLSGGETGICADVGSAEGIQYPDFSKQTMDKLRELLPSYSSPANPLDMTASLSYDTDKFAEVLRTLKNDQNIGSVVVGYTLLEEISDPAIEYMAPAMIQVAKEAPQKPIMMLPFVSNTRNERFATMLEEAGIPILPAPVYAMKILRYVKNFVEYNPEHHNLNVALPINAKTQKGRVALSEYESKVFLSGYGVPCVQGKIAKTAEEAVRIGNAFGFPLVMKIESADILHKSDIGGVMLNVRNEEEIRTQYNAILANAKNHNPDANINGVLVQLMLKSDTELIVGVSSDEQLGPSILVGLGGIFVEIFKDTAMSLVPISKYEAVEMIDSLKSSKLLQGYRGKKKADIESLIDLILKVSELAEKHKDENLEVDLTRFYLRRWCMRSRRSCN